MPTLKAGEKKFLAIASIVAVVFVAVVGVAVTLLTINNDGKESPYLQATTGTKFVHVEPTILCNIDLSNCRKGAEGTFAKRLPVPVGDKITVSVSRGIFDAPWALTLEFLTPKGFEQQPPELYLPNDKYSFTVRSTPDRILTNIEVRLPSGRTDTGGAPITRGFWSINTIPDGTKVPTPVGIANFTGSSKFTEPDAGDQQFIFSSGVQLQPYVG